MPRKKKESRSIENPNIPVTIETVADILSGPSVSSGVRINLQSALSYSPVYRAIDLISSDIARCHLHVYKRKGQGKERDTSHPVYKLVRRKVNPYLTSRDWIKTTIFHALFLGNAYSYVERMEDGTPGGIYLLDPEETYPVRVNGTVYYVTRADGRETKLPYDSVIHVKGLSDGLMGIGILCKARETIGLGIAARQFTARFFKNNARPGLAIEYPGNLKPDAVRNLRESWERMQSGLDNAHRVALLSEGMKLHTYGFNLQESDLTALRQFEIREVANFFGVPVHKLGDDSRTAFASLEQENLSYLSALEPWFGAVEEELFDKLLTERQKARESHLIEFTREELIRIDIKTQHEVWATGVQWGWYSRDEIRSMLNLNEIPNDLGKTFWQPANMIQLGQQPPPEQPPAVKEGVQRALADALRRGMTRLALHAERASKDPSKFLAWLDRMEEDHGKSLREMLSPVLDAANALRRRKLDVGQVVGKLLQRVRDDLLALSGECTASELHSKVTARAQEMKERWPGKITSRIIQ